MQSQVEDYLLSLMEVRLEQHSEDINSEIEGTLSVLAEMAVQISGHELDSLQEVAHILTLLKEVLGLQNIAIGSLDGTAYTSDGEKIYLADTEYFPISLKGERFFSKIVESKIDGQYINVYSVPIVYDEEVIGVLCASKLTQDFYKSLQLKATSNSMDHYIVDNQGDVVADSTGNSFYNSYNVFDYLESVNTPQNKIDEMKQNFSNKHNSSTRLKLDDVEYYFYYGSLNDSDWILINAMPVTELAKAVAPMSSNFTSMSVMFMIIVGVGGIILIFNKRKSLRYFEKVAYDDELTGEKNTKYLRDQFQSFLKKNSAKNYVLVVVNIQQFEVVSKVLNGTGTESILKNIFAVLLAETKDNELIAHGNRDEFICVWSFEDMIQIEERLRRATMKVKDIKLVAGGYLIKSLIVTFDEAVSNAKIAQSKVELNQERGYLLYNDELGEEEIKKKVLEEDIKEAILKKEFIAWYQPKYAKDGVTILGAEALIRWNKDGKIVSPATFIPLSENLGLIRWIDEIMFEKVCQDLKIWIATGIDVVPVSINLSRAYLTSLDYFNKLEDYMKSYSIPKELIQFEVTESVGLADEGPLKEVIKSIRDRGFKLLLDDFGVGYSSIKSISNMNFDVLKIDKSFIDGIGRKEGEAILSYTIRMAKELNMGIVAEGVETKEQYEFLCQCNCDEIQGYYFSKPLPPDEFYKCLERS